MTQPITILLAEDNPADVDLTQDCLEQLKVPCDVQVVPDGMCALSYLRQQAPYARARRPDLILLDLNLPRKDGREVLAEIKGDAHLKTIPVVVLTSSDAESDIARSYELHANCYVTKPVNLGGFVAIVQAIESFWLKVVRLPPRNGQ